MHRILLEGHTELLSLVISRKRNRGKGQTYCSLFTLLYFVLHICTVFSSKSMHVMLSLWHCLGWWGISFLLFPFYFCNCFSFLLSLWCACSWGFTPHCHSLTRDPLMTPHALRMAPKSPARFLESRIPVLECPLPQNDSSSFFWKINSCVPLKNNSFLSLKSGLLRYNLHTIKPTPLRGIIGWVLTQWNGCITITTNKIPSIPSRQVPLVLVGSQPLLSFAANGNHWTLRKWNHMVRSFFHLAKCWDSFVFVSITISFL